MDKSELSQGNMMNAEGICLFLPLCDDRAWVLLYDSGYVGVETELAKLLMHDSGVLVFSVSLKD